MSVSALRSLKKGDSEEREPFAAFVLDEETKACLAPIVSDRGWEAERIQGGGVANAVRSLALTSPPHILIVDLAESEEPRADITALAEVCEPGTIVIALGKTNDVTLYRDLVGAGIFDYLVKPINTDQLRGVISAAEELDHSAPASHSVQSSSGKLITAIGVRGGCGASMIAANVAWVLSHEFDKKVALVDLDIHFGTAALGFDLEPGRGLYDALENPGRVDGLFIERAMVKKSKNFSILSGEAPLGEDLEPNPTALSHLLEELKSNFNTVIVDLPRTLIGHQQFILAESDEIILVVDLSLVAVRDTIRMLAFIKDSAPETTVTIVANRVQGGVHDEVTRRDFESAIERKIDWIVPAETKVIIAAAKAGKALKETGKSSKAVKALHELGEHLLGEEEPKKKPSFWRRTKTGA